MDNLFQERYKENWKKFFEDDRVMMTQALAVCQTGVIKVDHRDVQRDCTQEPLWKSITQRSSSLKK